MNIHQLLTEDLQNKIDYVATTFGQKLIDASKQQESKPQKLAPAIVKKLAKADPDLGGKNLVWIARMYAAQQFKMEDLARLKDSISTFFQHRNKLSIKDLNSFKTLDALYDEIEKVEGKAVDKSKSALEKEAKLKGAEYIVNSPKFKAILPKTAEAACLYGSGTKWCTTGELQFKNYSSRGDLIIIIFEDSSGKTRKFQFHFETNSFMNERDTRASLDELKELAKHPEYTELLHILIDKHY